MIVIALAFFAGVFIGAGVMGIFIAAARGDYVDEMRHRKEIP